MLGLELASEARFERAMAPQVAGATAVNGIVIDTQACERVCFLAVLGDTTATGTVVMKLQTGSLANGSDMADVSGATTSTVTSDGTTQDYQFLVLDVVKPTKRYARVVITRAVANSVIESVIAICYDARLTPPTQDSVAALAVVNG